MMIGIIILVITCAIAIGVITAKEEEFFSGAIFGMIITLVITISVLCIVSFIIEPTPTSMDVYQGKTSLEITYRDGVPVDSVVVFKN